VSRCDSWSHSFRASGVTPVEAAWLTGENEEGRIPMWKVGEIAPVSVLGVDGYPYGFNLTTEDGKALVSFAYVTRARAEEAAAQIRSAIEDAVEVRPHTQDD
jgi:hypothetical protein